MMGQPYRHGDVSFHPVSEMEFRDLLKQAQPDQVKSKLDTYVVALGEKTGHRHVMTMERPKALTVIELNEDTVLFKLEAPAAMSHEEHHTFSMVPGLYVRKIEQQYNPFTEQAMRSLD